MTIQNGDRFVYVAVQDLAKVPDHLDVAGGILRIFKLVVVSLYKHCGKKGHRASDPTCPARAPEDLSVMVEAFRGGQHSLSNLHICPHSCNIIDKGMTFISSEHHYQYKKLKHHDLGEEASLLVLEEDAFRVMKKAKELVPKDKPMMCKHAQEVLLKSAVTIAEATGDTYWGSGLNVQQTKDCLMEYWPGENRTGAVLMAIRDECQGNDSTKCKADSPLASEPKLSKS